MLPLHTKQDTVNSDVHLLSPMVQFNTRCAVDYRKFPFDVVICTVAYAIPTDVLVRDGISLYDLQWLKSETPIRVITHGSSSTRGSVIFL